MKLCFLVCICFFMCVFICEVWMRAKMKCQGTLSNLWKKHWNLSWLHSRIDALDQMWLNRSNPQSWLTDGVLVKTATVYGWALEVLARRMPRCCGRCLGVIRWCYIVGAPTHAAVRLLGPEAKTLHKWANVSPNSGLDRRSLQSAKTKAIPLRRRSSRLWALHESSWCVSCRRFSFFVAAAGTHDVGHGSLYLEQWFGRVPIGVQLLRPLFSDIWTSGR